MTGTGTDGVHTEDTGGGHGRGYRTCSHWVLRDEKSLRDKRVFQKAFEKVQNTLFVGEGGRKNGR